MANNNIRGGMYDQNYKNIYKKEQEIFYNCYTYINNNNAYDNKISDSE